MTDRTVPQLTRDTVQDYEITFFEETLKLGLKEDQIRFLMHIARVVALTNMTSLTRANEDDAATTSAAGAAAAPSATAPSATSSTQATAAPSTQATAAPAAGAALPSAPMGANTATLSPAHAAAAASIAAASAAHANPAPPALLTVLPVGYQYEVPLPTASGPFYAVTRGRRVGVMSGWPYTQPFVSGVRGAAFVKVGTIHEGRMLIEAALLSSTAGVISG